MQAGDLPLHDPRCLGLWGRLLQELNVGPPQRRQSLRSGDDLQSFGNRALCHDSDRRSGRDSAQNDPFVGAADRFPTGNAARPQSVFGSCPGAWCKSVALYAAPGG